MKSLILTLLALAFPLGSRADISIEDLPLLEGTPLEVIETSDSGWDVLDYLEDESGLIWVWLARDTQHAYVVYPSTNAVDSVIFPDTVEVSVVAGRVNIAFLGDSSQQISLTRFGGETILLGDDIRISYTPAEYIPAEVGNTYILNSPQSMDVTFNATEAQLGDITIGGDLTVNTTSTTSVLGGISTTGGSVTLTAGGNLTISTTGSIRQITGTSGSDTIQGFDSNTIWNLSNGTISLDDSTLNFGLIEGFVGGSANDTFVLDSGESDVSIGGGDIHSLCTSSSSLTISATGSITEDIQSPCIITAGSGSITLPSGLQLNQQTFVISESSIESSANAEQNTATKKKSKGGSTDAVLLLLLALGMATKKRRTGIAGRKIK